MHIVKQERAESRRVKTAAATTGIAMAIAVLISACGIETERDEAAIEFEAMVSQAQPAATIEASKATLQSDGIVQWNVYAFEAFTIVGVDENGGLGFGMALDGADKEMRRVPCGADEQMYYVLEDKLAAGTARQVVGTREDVTVEDSISAEFLQTKERMLSDLRENDVDRVVLGATCVAQLTGTAGDEELGEIGEDTDPEDPIHAACGDRYRVELKAWIPHALVADPDEPFYQAIYLRTSHIWQSWFRGDNHTGYNGSYRGRVAVNFTWNGSSISSVSSSRLYGRSYRDWRYWYILTPWWVTSGYHTALQTCCMDVSASGRNLSLNIHESNPLVIYAFLAAIDSHLDGYFTTDGRLRISYQTDLFPSHGIRVTRNGSDITKRVVYDASGVNANGVIGMTEIGIRLNQQHNSDTFYLSAPNPCGGGGGGGGGPAVVKM